MGIFTDEELDEFNGNLREYSDWEGFIVAEELIKRMLNILTEAKNKQCISYTKAKKQFSYKWFLEGFKAGNDYSILLKPDFIKDVSKKEFNKIWKKENAKK